MRELWVRDSYRRVYKLWRFIEERFRLLAKRYSHFDVDGIDSLEEFSFFITTVR